MRIGIDARLYGTENTGLGRYISQLVDNLGKYDKGNTYIIFLRSKNSLEGQKMPKNMHLVTADVPIYSLKEQLVLPLVFYKYKLDLLHVPHFNAPLLYLKPKILTIHDLIKHRSVGKDTTTRGSFRYHFLRLGYQLLTNIVIKQATAILVPSNYVKNDIVDTFYIDPKKIHVTYEAATGSISKVSLDRNKAKKILAKYGLSQPFLVYTGNVYPHKNIDILLNAIQNHNNKRELDLQLAIICGRSVFWERLNKKIEEKNLSHSIKLLGYLEDSEISKIYSLAIALVHPSKMEGFGLTGLEAMGVGLPVLSSNASCLPEIYGGAALFFDPDNVAELNSLVEKIISDSSLREHLSKIGYIQSKKYSWSKMVKETIHIYESCISLRSSK